MFRDPEDAQELQDFLRKLSFTQLSALLMKLRGITESSLREQVSQYGYNAVMEAIDWWAYNGLGEI